MTDHKKEEEIRKLTLDCVTGFSIFVRHYMKESAPDYMVEEGHVGYSMAQVFRSLYEIDPALASQLFGALLLYYVQESGFEGLPPCTTKNIGE